MASISSRSDGEISSSDSEKATTALPSRNGTNIDRPTRNLSTSRSPAIRLAYSRSRSRSRSPYRAARGEKRHREDGHSREHSKHDSRTFSVRYEDERKENASHRERTYEDHDSGRPRRTYLHHDEEVDRHRHFKRPRTRSHSRSRSPYRHGRDVVNTKSDIRDDGRKDPYEEDKQYRNSRGLKGEGESRIKFSVSDRSNAARGARLPKNSAETSDQERGLVPPKVSSSATSNKSLARSVNQSKSAPGDAFNASAAITDEAAAIEARRKRREAIKNKYRGEGTPLLVQALHLGTDGNSSMSTPKSTDAQSRRSGQDAVPTGREEMLTFTASPVITAPQTPKDTSGPQSPASVNFAQDEELANRDAASPANDGDDPSAADYDPTIDMQEERARHDMRLFKEDEDSSRRADEKAIEQRADSTSPSRKTSSPLKSKAEFDMFADEDDDDMFAEAPTRSIKTAGADAKTAQALDVNMMDDWDDPEGYYNTILGELLENRYHVTQNLGRGMFSSVVRATDNTSGQPVAIKIVRNNETMRKAGIKEIDILKDIATNDPEDKKHVIRLYRSFDHKGHLCMVFENLSLNLREVLKKFGRDVGINLKAIRAYAQQLFLGLSLLKKCQYLHADLKPDNILVNEARNMLKVCDLGSASPITENVTAPYLVSRFYRAPEIILGIPYDYGIDMWSIGCTLFELYTGKILFTGRNNNGMLKSIMDCRGKFPNKLLRRGTLAYEYFDDLLNFQSMEQDKVTGRTVSKMVDIKAKPVRDLRSRLIPTGKRMDEAERKEVELFHDLLDKCLDLRPDKRITPTEALKHPFILRSKV